MSSYVKQVIYSPEEIEVPFTRAFEDWKKLSEEERKKNPRWWSGRLEINWDSKPFEGKNGSRFWNVITNVNNKRGRPHMRYTDETNMGSILTTDKNEFNELKKKFPHMFAKEERGKDMAPDIQFRKWSGKIETEEKDKLHFKKGSDGKEIMPDDKSKSKVFAALYIYFMAVSGEIQYQRQIGRIVDDESRERALPNAIFNNTTKITIPVSTRYKKGENINKDMLNPLVRVKLVFNKDDQNKGTQFLDKRKKFMKDGKQDYERAKLEDGSNINNDNVHKWIQFATVMSGLIDISGICMHSMGISGQAKSRIIVSQPREKSKMTAADIFFNGDDDPDLAGDNDGEGDEESPAKPTNSSTQKDDNKKANGDMYQQLVTTMKSKN